ncbi:cytochrome b/b6 domain-containing protein [Chelatococcus reniformis]|uniref:Cytochrome b561 n=1 Tax=Chelatococcus reniformis TaxID=1494448 RepID=A0A916UR45_9HYPH|nr:cytochrome b/b6 domain-containing protein [Chelatococcus reniformis]GGC84211.1 cytochrome b561 [Chelatococcus reniformis]
MSEAPGAVRTGAGAEADGSSQPVRAWDLPTRLYHWLQLALVVGSYYTQWWMDPAADPTMRFHRWLGYSILTLLVFRLLWGVVGGSTARFGSFVRSPGTVVRYAWALARGRAPAYLGHNPLGTLMVLALLAVLAAQALSGLFAADSNAIFGGPFAHLDPLEDGPAWKGSASRYHHLGANILLVLVGVHVVINLYYQYVRRDKLISAMASGYKPARAYADQPEAAGGSPARAAVCLITAAVIVFGGIKIFDGSL